MGATLAKPFELNCADYQIKSASIGHGGGGTVFRCTLGPISDDVLEALADAVRTRRVIRFAFPQRPLLLEAVEVQRRERGFIRIGGRVVNGD